MRWTYGELVTATSKKSSPIHSILVTDSSNASYLHRLPMSKHITQFSILMPSYYIFSLRLVTP